jgi:hypothetical protein
VNPYTAALEAGLDPDSPYYRKAMEYLQAEDVLEWAEETRELAGSPLYIITLRGMEMLKRCDVKVAEMPLGPHSEARAELTERAESTLREQLESERERADRLETELQQERSKGCWVQPFGSYSVVQ